MKIFKFTIVFCCLFYVTLLYPDSVAHYHKVKKGETLFSISKKYNIDIATIKSLNNINSSVIHPGQRLVIRKAFVKNTNSSVNNVVKNVNDSYTTSYYKVQKGDTLSKISRKFKVPIARIKNMNNLRSDRLSVGQNLKISVVYKPAPVRLPSIENLSPTPIAIVSEKTYYTVKQEDTLESIADRFGITSEEIKRTNLLDEKDFKVGQVLVIQKCEPITENETSKLVPDEDDENIRFRLIKEAFAYLGTPYRLGGSGKRGIDCSALTRNIYKNIGLSIPTTSYLQYKEGEEIGVNELAEGDLLFFRRRGVVDHVAIYIGKKRFIHASYSQRKVAIASMDDSYFRNHFVAAKRYLPLEEDPFAKRGKYAVEE